MPEGIEDHISELDDAGYLTWRKYYGIDGCYVNNARVLCREGSDYRYAEHVRVLNKDDTGNLQAGCQHGADGYQRLR